MHAPLTDGVSPADMLLVMEANNKRSAAADSGHVDKRIGADASSVLESTSRKSALSVSIPVSSWRTRS